MIETLTLLAQDFHDLLMGPAKVVLQFFRAKAPQFFLSNRGSA